jgi:hypothetical protein
VLRDSEMGAVLKNLFGLVPIREKVRYHKKLVPVLLDLYEAVGGIDLAVLDGTKRLRFNHLRSWPEGGFRLRRQGCRRCRSRWRSRFRQ